ncbi:hypothetical protein EDB38_1069 [Vibrio crassostreae]|uniref:Uncharacterized protein n=1 Tax=Vibrio crassostreae TaxID=246167 RepID=A0A822MW05_9VIBR|nr:hypothetical protein EDB35_1479 [Vibrio crassostreae]TCN94303.1 hypothetical protein EDB30_1289 [Vibrio crassostreae]TCT51236.1 hypothetical protein EDB42_1069 [Vibrio crassostreae]TCT76065.1 hypothetical protein EDB41_1069 [Vibrio crassostreae]TCT95255.1 hypothetical protein EDB38_1069 [Vibrio crassostreae]
MGCVIPGCGNPATNNFSVRLRREDTSAIWAPNTNAYVCDEHAAQGFDITVHLVPRNDDSLVTHVSSGAGRGYSRTTRIRNQP